MRKLISTGSPFEKTAGYSRAVVQGDWCFVSGTTGYDYGAMTMPDSVEAQCRNCLVTIAKALNLSRAEVHGVVSFYQDFTTAPDPRPCVELCRAEAVVEGPLPQVPAVEMPPDDDALR